MRRVDWKYGDLALRCAGLLLLGLAAMIGRHLFAAADPSAKARLSAYLLALIGIASASAGAAMTLLGGHLRDRVELSARWTIHITDRDRSAR